MTERMVTPDGEWVDTRLVGAALPLLFNALDRAVSDEASQTNSSASGRVRGLRSALFVIAGSLGFLGPDAIDDLREWVTAVNADA